MRALTPFLLVLVAGWGWAEEGAFLEVDSSVFEAVRYEKDSERLTVRFTSGGEAVHGEVPADVAEAFLQSPLMGGFYKGQIATRYPLLEESGIQKTDSEEPDLAAALNRSREDLSRELGRTEKSMRDLEAAGMDLRRGRNEIRDAQKILSDGLSTDRLLSSVRNAAKEVDALVVSVSAQEKAIETEIRRISVARGEAEQREKRDLERRLVEVQASAGMLDDARRSVKNSLRKAQAYTDLTEKETGL